MQCNSERCSEYQPCNVTRNAVPTCQPSKQLQSQNNFPLFYHIPEKPHKLHPIFKQKKSMSKKSISVGLIGFGLSGRYLIAPFLNHNPHFQLKTVVQQRALNAHHIFPQVKSTHERSDILNDPEIDLVIISSPNETHYEYALEALQANKHVLVEKPMTATSQQARHLIEVAKQKNKVLTVYQNRRFDGGAKTVKEIIQKGLLGHILSYEAHFDRWVPNLNPKKWKEIPHPSNGILYDLGSHLIDEALTLFGSPHSFTGEVFTQRNQSNIDDAFDLRLNYGNLKVHLRASLLVREQGPRYIIHGTKGSFIKYGLDPQEETLKSGLNPDAKGFGHDSPQNYGVLNTDINDLHFNGRIETLPGNYGLFFQNLYEAIIGDSSLSVPPEEVVEQIQIMEQIKRE